MRVGQKIFVSYSALILLMGGLFLSGTYVVVNQLIRHMAEVKQEDRLIEVSRDLDAMYSLTSGWQGLDTDDIAKNFGQDSSILIKDEHHDLVTSWGEMEAPLIEKFGIKRELVTEDRKVWTLYYANDVIYFVGLFQYAFRDSLILFLSLALVVFGILSIFLSYYLARHLTSPIRRIIPVIDALAKGNFHIKVPVKSADEYGKIGNAINRMSDDLEQAEQVRKNMTADVAHELRTPLAIVSGKMEYLQQRNQSIAPEELLPLQDELIRLQRLVNDLRELSQAEAGQLKLHQERVNIHHLLARIVDKVTFEAEEREVTVHYSEPLQPIEVMVDKHRMTQVCLNILMNSIQYTPPGGEIRVEAKIENKHVLITVKDNGVGIEPEHIPFLFQRFYRTDQARDRDHGGTGLGLAIAAEYVRAHGGEIAVESEKDKGTIFQIHIPIVREGSS